jgi:hypothetical protein
VESKKEEKENSLEKGMMERSYDKENAQNIK